MTTPRSASSRRTARPSRACSRDGPSGAAEPGVVTRLADARATVRDQRLYGELCAEVTRMHVANDFALVVVLAAQGASDEIREGAALRPADVDHAVHRRRERDIRERRHD